MMAAARRTMSSSAASSSGGGGITATINLLPSRSANLGIIELNNPPALNSLTLPMVRCLNDVLPLWQSDPTIKATLFIGRHAEDNKRPAFCAGGDVKSIYNSGMGTSGVEQDSIAFKQSQHGYGERGLLTADFFREEYKMNHLIATQDVANKPQISIWDGVVMGGGVGISVHGKYRVATELTKFAMPEVGIGLFPDIGGTYLLPRLKGGIGQYIALTGHRLGPDDLIYAGIATHYVPSDKIGELKEAIIESTKSDVAEVGDCVAGTLMSFHEDAHGAKGEDSFLSQNRDDIDKVFGDGDAALEDIVVSLEQLGSSGSKFAKETLSTLRTMSPTSLKVTHEGLRRGAELATMADCLTMEYRMAQGFMRKGSDFYEGVRAMLIDKDRSPKWSPGELEGVTDDVVKSYFDSLGENDLDLEEEGSKRSSKM